MSLRGLATVITMESVGLTHPWLSKVSEWAVPIESKSLGVSISVPAAAIIFLVMVIVGAYLLRYTRFGRNVYAIGGSEPSARLMGLSVNSTQIGVYVISGFCAAVAGLLFSFYTASADPLAGIGYELLQAVGSNDYPLLQGIFLVITLAVLVANLLADVVYLLIDPRTRREG